MRRSLSFCAIVVCLVTGTVEAQSVQRPSRPYRGLFGGGPPPDPDRNRQELTLTTSVLAGYDDYLAPGGEGGPVGPGMGAPNAYSGYVDAALSYFVGRSARSFSADANAFTNAYSGLGVDPTVGGGVRLIAQTDLGRRSGIDVTQHVNYAPSLVLGAFDGLSEDVDPQLLPDAGVGSGFVNQRSWESTTSVSLDRRWTARQSTALQGTYSRRTYLDELGYDATSVAGGLVHSWNPTRRVSIGGSYHVSDTEAGQDAENSIPLQNHTVEFSTTYGRRLSPSRELTLGGGIGATYVDTLNGVDRQPESYWMPSGYATLSLGVGRTWALAVDYRRSVNVLTGVSLESFATDAASLRANGTIGRRIEAVISTAFSNGRTGTGDDPGRFESYSGLAQLRYAMSRCCAVSVNYNYYYYRLRDFSNLAPGLPPEYDHNAVRVGFSFWLPLYGSYGAAAEAGSSGRR